MKKKLLVAISLVSALCGSAQTTAPNFDINDCSGTHHNLYSELNTGKVVVIVFVMPCASCIGPALSAFNEVQNYATSDPGRVVMYISDDLGTTSCSTLTNWINTNGMAGTPAFSNTALKESDYGSGGMPKIVVLAGTTHEILLIQNGGLNVSDFNAAISQGLVSGIEENSKADFNLNLFPNPSPNNKTNLEYSLSRFSDVTIEIFNSLGSKVNTVNYTNVPAGKNQALFDSGLLSDGVYFMKLTAENSFQVLRFTVAH